MEKKSNLKIKQCNRNPFLLADFAYDGIFSDGNGFCLRIPERDVIPFAQALLKAYEEDMQGKVEAYPPVVKWEEDGPVFIPGHIKRKE